MQQHHFSIVDVTCARNNQILFEPIRFTLHPGEIKYICGENGIGKTTLLRALIGLSRPHLGEIKWAGESIWNNEDFNKQLFFLGHKNTIKSSLTVYENLLLSSAMPVKPSNTAILSALDCVGLTSKKNLLASALSSGQKQRLALSKLLLATSTLWILDEPFNGLDTDGFNWLQSLMLYHVKNQGMIIFTSHQSVSGEIETYINFDSIPLIAKREETIVV